MNKHLYIYIQYAISLVKEEAMNLKDSEAGYMESMEKGKGRDKCFNYIIISKMSSKKIYFKIALGMYMILWYDSGTNF